MTYLNQVPPTDVQTWVQNFAERPNNIFIPFQDKEIYLNKNTWLDLMDGMNNHVNLYFGLNDNLDIKVIVTAAYELDSFDSDQNGFVDILGSDRIFELYDNTTIDVNTAREFVARWAEKNDSDPYFKHAFLLPRPNFQKFFVTDNATRVHIFFGANQNDETVVMEQNPDAASPIDMVINKANPCPSTCSLNGLQN